MASVRILPDFATLRAALPRLDESSSGRGSLFQSLAWFENLYAHGLNPASPLLLAADEQGCLPLLDEGDRICGFANYYSSLFGPIGTLPASMDIAFQLTKRAQIDLHPLDAQTPCFQQLKQALTTAGYWVDDYFCFGNWYLEVAGRSYAAYLAGRNSQLRNTLQRGKSKLDKAGRWGISIQQQADAGLEDAITAFTSVYAKSWKQAEPQTEFIPNLCRTAARQGWLRLGILRLDGVPLAAQLWLVHMGTASIYKLAYDEAASAYSAGTVLTAAMFEQALDHDQVSEVDYLNGDEPYKRDWMSHRRERRGIIAFDLSQWSGMRAAARHWGGNLLRRLRRTETLPRP